MLKIELEKFKNSLLNKTKEELISIAVENFIQRFELSARITEEEKSNHEMFQMFTELKDKLEKKEKELKELREQNQHLTGVRVIQAQEMFGKSSEKSKTLLSEDLSDTPEDPSSEDADPAEKTNACKQSNVVTFSDSQKKKSKSKGHRESILSGLPQRKVYEYDIDELNKRFGAGNWMFAMWEAHDTVESVRAYTYRKTVYTPIIKIKESYDLKRIPYEGRIIDKSIASASLLSEILCDFAGMSLPMYRMEHDIDRYGFPLSRQTMSNWIRYAGNKLFRPIVKHLTRLLRTCKYQQCDETPYKVIAEKDHLYNYIWVHRISELVKENPIVLFCFEPSRSADHLLNFYEDGIEKLYLTSDAYGAYVSLEQQNPDTVSVSGCFAHCRRRWVKSLMISGKDMPEDEKKSLTEYKAIELIGKIYAADSQLKELEAQDRYEQRREQVLPLVDDFFKYVNTLDGSDPLNSDKLNDAIQYTKNQEARLRGFLKDGNIPIDNSACERNVKIIATHRKNSLFSYSISGAEATMAVISLIETAKENGAIPYYYLKYLLERMSKVVIYNHEYDIDEMMPWSDVYKTYEAKQRKKIHEHGAPPSDERPKTPKTICKDAKEAV